MLCSAGFKPAAYGFEVILEAFAKMNDFSLLQQSQAVREHMGC
jgi:hypothetical protein